MGINTLNTYGIRTVPNVPNNLGRHREQNTQANVLTKEKDSTTYKVGGGCFIQSPSLFIKYKTHQHGE